MSARIVWCHLGDCDRDRTADLAARNDVDAGVVAVHGFIDGQGRLRSVRP